MNELANALAARLAVVASDLPEAELREVLDFAEFVQSRLAVQEQRAFSLYNLAKAYGDDEPEYTDAHIIRR